MKRVATQFSRSLIMLRERAAVSIGLSVLALALPACASLESGVYQTLPGATVEESGDAVPGNYRIIPIFATFTFDLSTVPPSLTAVIPISNITLLPQAWLSISQVGAESVQISWATNFANHVLEYAASFPAAGWSRVTNAVAATGNRFSITVTVDESRRFYRLRKPGL